MRYRVGFSFLLAAVVLSAAAFAAACTDGETEKVRTPLCDAANWQALTSGNAQVKGEVPVSLDDGSIRFFRSSYGYELGEEAFTDFSCGLKVTGDWSLWLGATSPDVASAQGVRLEKRGDVLGVVLSSSPEEFAAVVSAELFEGAWNDLSFSLQKEDDSLSLSLALNDVYGLQEGTMSEGVTLEGGARLVYRFPEGFETGGWIAVQTTDADDYLQLRPFSEDPEEDVPIVACVGDSITEGSGSSDGFTKGYPAQLQKQVGGKYNVLNYGLSGRTVRRDLPASGGTPQGWMDNVQWTGVQAIKPDIVFVKLGTNDSKTSLRPLTTRESFEEAYTALVQSILAVDPPIRVILCTSATAFSEAYAINNDNVSAYVVPAQKAVAEALSLELLDLNTLTANKSALFPDGIHPNDRGYAMFAEIFAEYLGEGTLSASFLEGIETKYTQPA